jgi:hypothetical protein
MSSSGRRLFLVAAALSLLTVFPVPSAAQRPVKRQTAAVEVWVRTELYFGTSMANGEVSDAQFSNFVDSEVTRLFPDGLTLLTGQGQFKNAGGIIIHEKSHLLILLYPTQMQDANKKIQDLREWYKKAFGQESVLRVDSLSLVSF